MTVCMLVPKAGFEPAHPGGRQTLNLVRLPFRHFGTLGGGLRLVIMVFYGNGVKVKEQEDYWKILCPRFRVLRYSLTNFRAPLKTVLFRDGGVSRVLKSSCIRPYTQVFRA